MYSEEGEIMMTEKTLRRLHRTIGLPLVLFIFIQSATGLFLTIENMLDRYWDWAGFLRDVHHSLGILGDIYRLLLGFGMLWMAISGMLIYRAIRIRTKKSAQG
jgi:hypothetical protein